MPGVPKDETITAAAKRKVERNPCASTAGLVGTLLAVVLWGAPQVGLSMPLWVAALAVGWLIAGALSFSNSGLLGLWRFLLHGRGRQGN